MFCTLDIIKFTPIRLLVFIVWFVMNISNAAAADNWFESGYKTITELFNGKNTTKRRTVIVRPKNDGRPYLLHRFPGERAAISARLYPPIRSVEVLRGCIREWCHVRIGSAFGWLKKNRLDLSSPNDRQVGNPTSEPKRFVTPLEKTVEPPRQTPALPQQAVAPVKVVVNIPLPVRKGPVPPLKKQVQVPQDPQPQPKKQAQVKEPVQNTVAPLLNRKVIDNRPILKPRQRTVVTSLKLSDIKKQKYSLTRVEGITFLPVREDHADNARILGGIPFFASDIEALGLCVDGWCLVQRGELRGWIKREHLSEIPREDAPPLLQLKNTAGAARIPVFTKPDKKADIASYIIHPATNILSIGACDHKWCKIRYSDATGWIQSTYLVRQ